MRCFAYCTASSFNLKPLLDYLKGRFKANLHRDAIHIEVPHPNGVIADIFYFSYGTVVCWGLSKEEDQRFLLEVKGFEVQPRDDIEVDAFTFSYGDTQRVNKDEITLPNREILTKLAVSHGLAQSVRLGTFEVAIQKTFNSYKHIPDELAKNGKIGLSKKEIRRKMGELFIERNSINLHFDVLDTPEFFWEYPELEPLYTMIANYLEIGNRVKVLNQRLDVVHELFEMLGNELNHQHSSRLEWTIIWLIIIEVTLSLLRDVFRLI